MTVGYYHIIHIIFDICFCDLYTMASTSVTNPVSVAIQLREADIANALLIRPFSVRPTAEQNVIVNERPTPNLTIKNKGPGRS